MKGIVLAGGQGTRLYPITLANSKQLLPVYDKPMIYYPLSTLMLAGIREILVITTPRDLQNFQILLGDGSRWGISIQFKVQERPRGLADALILGEEFIDGGHVALILGDNIFHGSGMGRTLQNLTERSGATVFSQKVSNPNQYGVVEFDKTGKIRSIEEKPLFPKSNNVLTGLYFYDERASELAKKLSPSTRGELEITDLNLEYLKLGELHLQQLERGTAWLDTGSFESLYEASEYVKILERRQGQKISVPEEIAWRLGFITNADLRKLGESLSKSDYGKYLISILEADEKE